MNDFDKIERLKEKANITYEEAKEVLEEANGDLLDAVIILEKRGKVSKPENESHSTKAEDSKELPIVVENSDDGQARRKEKMGEFGRKMRALIDKLFVNYIVIEKDEKQIAKIPLWMFLIGLAIGIEVVPICIVISLFFGVRYSFVGEDDMVKANAACEKVEKVVGDVVESVKDGYDKL